MRLLITGHTGFVGRHLLRLLSNGTLNSPVKKLITPSSNDLDLLSGMAADQIIKTLQPTHVLHLAWARTGLEYYDLADSHKIWGDRTFSLVRDLSDSGIISWVVGTGLEAHDNAGGLSPYGLAKAELRNGVIQLDSSSSRWISLPYIFSVFHQRPRLVNSYLQGNSPLYPHKEEDYLEIRDVARQLANIVFTDSDQACSISSQRQTSNVKLCSQIKRRSGEEEFKSCSCLDGYMLSSDESGSFYTSLLLD
jgi:hypothetical protein